MPRVLLAGERATIAAPVTSLFLRVEAANANGTMVDVSTWVETVTLDNDVNNGAVRCIVTLARESGQGGTQSLAPFLSSSLLNRDNANAYAPLLNPNRAIRVTTNLMPGVSGPGAGDWRVMINGLTDDVNWGESPVTVTCRDITKRMLDTQIESVRTYGALAPGTAAETVMQSIINDNMAIPPALVLGPTGSPNWSLLPYAQDTTKVYDAIRALAMQIGWDVRMRWSGSAEQLTLYRPDRTLTAANWALGPNEYYSIPSLGINDDFIRNVIDVTYRDAVTKLSTTIQVTDTASVALFGRRYMRITEDNASNIDTSAEATAMATAALSDLAFPIAEQEIVTPYFWPVELGDTFSFAANATHYDSAQIFAVVSYRHTLSHGSGTTTLRTSGKPRGAYLAWLQLTAEDPSGALPLVPEILYVSAPVPVYVGGIIVGWRLSGRVDSDTSALIITLSSTLTMRTTAPSHVTAINGAVTEHWMNMAPSAVFTVEVLLSQGGSGQVTIVPASVYNPTATIPPARGGILGGAFVQALSRTPTTAIVTAEYSLTAISVTLSVRPTTATIKYRYAPNVLVGTEPWVATVNAAGSVSFLVDVSTAPVMLEYHGVSVDLVAEEVHSIRLDMGTAPSVTLALAELTPNMITASLGIDDDVVGWSLYAKRGGTYPDLLPASPDLDPQYLRASGNAQLTTVKFYAAGTGLGTSVDQWTAVAVAHDLYGTPSVRAVATIFVRGTSSSPTVGALSALSAVVVNEGGASFIDLTWANNSVIEAALASRFGVNIYENSAFAFTQQAKTDHLGTDSIAAAGGWHRPCSPSTAGAPYANLLTFWYDVDLFDAGSLVARYTTSITAWFLGTGFGTPPQTVPNTPTVAQGLPDCLVATWSGAGLSATFDIQIEWYYSTDNFATVSVMYMSEVLVPQTVTQSACGLLPPRVARCRLRYVNAYGNGAWTAYSNTVAAPYGTLP